MSGECVCAKHRHAVSLADARSLYDEVSHKIDDNILSVKLIKNRHRVETVDEQTIETAPTIDVNCLDRYGKVINIAQSTELQSLKIIIVAQEYIILTGD